MAETSKPELTVETASLTVDEVADAVLRYVRGALDLLVRDGREVGGRLLMLDAVGRHFRGGIFDLVHG